MNTIVIGNADTRLHDKQVSVVVSENGIPIAYAIQIIVFESATNPRHEHIIQVEEVETIVRVLLG